jgi:hypothetical protein
MLGMVGTAGTLDLVGTAGMLELAGTVGMVVLLAGGEEGPVASAVLELFVLRPDMVHFLGFFPA